ncbi:MAG: hypothetical protein HY563_08225 [Ignavibacteriales bacterium]|nr:hypothetical protein [Ignavibacteriales bacterium]
MKKPITRRRFLHTAAGAGIAFSAIPHFPLKRNSKPLERRALGSTGLSVTVLGLGCVAIGYGSHSPSEGADLVHWCIDEAMKRFPFATALVPLSSTDSLVNDFGKVLFPLAQERKFGVIAMKVLTAGKVTEFVQESLRYSFSLPVSTAIVGMGTRDEVRQNVEVARMFQPMTPAEMVALEAKTCPFAATSVMWWKRM